MSPSLSAVVAGHICLDITPDLDHYPAGKFPELFQPGRLLEVGPATFSTGGAVSNTGLVLKRLGIKTRLIGKVGDDLLGAAVQEMIRQVDPELVEGIGRDQAVSTSYSVIISPPGIDRTFLHNPGANDFFAASDVDFDLVSQASLFHFGYPPAMKRMYRSGGAELTELFARAKATGATTSLDASFPDASSESGRADWRAIFRRTLPYVDIFLPSFEEILFMLQPEQYQRLLGQAGSRNLIELATAALLGDLATDLIDMGVKIAVIKLGERGLYMRTAGERELEKIGRARPTNLMLWAGRELWAPCFRVEVAGTTGAGDATIAGFLSALLRDMSPEGALTAAVAVGAYKVEDSDVISALPTWAVVWQRIQFGWERLPLAIQQPGWIWASQPGVWTRQA